MKKTICKTLSLLVAVFLTATAAGCTRTTTETVWEEGEGSTVITTYTSGTQGTEGTFGTAGTTVSGRPSGGQQNLNNEGRTEATGITDNGGTTNKYDLKGASVVIAHWGSETDSSDATYQDEKKLIADIEKKYNCKISFNTVNDSMSYLSAWVTAAQAGTKFADIVQLASSWPYPAHMKAGYLHKLDNYLDLSSNIFNQTATNQLAWNGSHYVVVFSNRMYVGSGLYFNRAVFSKFNQKTPDTYVDANNWNWETFRTLAQSMTGARDGQNYYGFSQPGGTTVTAFATSNGAKNVVKKDGKYTFNMGAADYIESIQFCYDLYNTWKVCPPWGDNGKAFDAGQTAMMIDSVAHGPSHLDALGSENVGFTYVPIGPRAKDYNVSVTETTSFGIPSTVKNPDVIAAILYDYMYPYKWRATLQQQLENQFGDAKSLSVAMDLAVRGTRSLELAPLYTYITRSVSWGDYGIPKQTSPQAYIESVSAAAQAELNSIWGQ